MNPPAETITYLYDGGPDDRRAAGGPRGAWLSLMRGAHIMRDPTSVFIRPLRWCTFSSMVVTL